MYTRSARLLKRTDGLTTDLFAGGFEGVELVLCLLHLLQQVTLLRLQPVDRLAQLFQFYVLCNYNRFIEA